MWPSMLRWSLGVAAALALPRTSLAQSAPAAADQSQAGYQPSVAFPESYDNGGYFYPGRELRALPGARANAAVAWAQFHRAEQELSLLINDAARKFRRSSELKNATIDEQDAWDNLNAVRAEATAGVKDDTSYKASLALQRRLQAQIQDARNAESPQLDKVLALATLKLSYAATSSAMEAAAVSANPRVKSARQRLVDASRRVAELREQYDEAVRHDPLIVAARHRLEDARTYALGAETTYIEAAKVANVAVDFAYHLYQHPYPNNIYGGGYGYGGYGYGGGFQVGYPLGYPVAGLR